MAHEWDAGQYLRFTDARTLPAVDLLSRIELVSPATVVDLGCGPGNSTSLLLQRWPEAAVTGLDSSDNLLDTARRDHPGARFVPGDILDWAPAEPADVVFANASLQWVGGHERLMPRLFDQVARGGAFAVQMPRNHDFATHALMRQVAAEGDWRDRLAGARALAGSAARVLLRSAGAALSGLQDLGDQLHSGDGRSRGDHRLAAWHWAAPVSRTFD